MERTSFGRGVTAKVQNTISQNPSSGRGTGAPVAYGRGQLLKSDLMLAYQRRSSEASAPVDKPSDSGVQSNSISSNHFNGCGRGAILKLATPVEINGHAPPKTSTKREPDVNFKISKPDSNNDFKKEIKNLPPKQKSIQTTKNEGPRFKSMNNIKNENNEIVKSSSQKEESEQKKENNEMAKSPINKLGSSGHKIGLHANFLRLDLHDKYSVYEYQVVFDPQIDHKAFRIKIFKALAITLNLKTYLYVGDNLYVPVRFIDKNTYKSMHPIDGTDVDIEINFIKEKPPRELCHFYNILFKRVMSELKLKRINRNNFDTACAKEIPQHKLQVWPGYVTTIEEFEDGLMLNMDPLHRILRTTSVLHEISNITSRCQTRVQDTIKSALIGKAVLTTYNWKLYKIDDINFKMNPLSTFELQDGTTISYVDYYKNNYGKEIKDLQQPMLINRKKIKGLLEEEERLFCLVPELCVFTGLTEEMKDDLSLMKDLAQFTRVTPNQRFNALKLFVERIQECPGASNILSDWGLSVSNVPVELEARQLPPEVLIFGKENKIKVNDSVSWMKEVSMYPVISPIDIKNWIILYTKRDEHSTNDLAQCLKRCGPPIGINVDSPQMIMLNSDRTENYLNKLREVVNTTTQIVVCVFPVSRDDRYSAIKKHCCLTNPIPSQVVNGPTIKNTKRLRAVSQNILLQMNCKLGGSLWAVKIPYKSLMVVGLDVYHAAGAKSIGGFVSSYDVNITQWYSRICIQRPGQELIDSLRQFFFEGLKVFCKKNGTYPEKIIIYRDGVGDGQLNHCKEYEITQFISCFKEVDNDYNPKLTFIIVQKRNNTRLFKQSGNNEYDNPLPGTVVDSKIVRKYLYDFYLVSQKVRDSCLVPTHYVVLYNSDSGMTPDHVQRFTFKMCHLYYNWSGTIRTPAPCQYAHKLAYLIGGSLQKEHHPNLMGSLFFL